MPLLVLLLALVVLLVTFIFGIPISLLQRYRRGIRRARARGWVVTMNLAALLLSVSLLLASSTAVSLLAPRALQYSLTGLAVGGLLGIVGLLSSRWEATGGGLYYTPNAALVFAISVVVAARIGYGLYRAWSAWGAAEDSWVVEAGVAGSLGFGAVILGYYLIFLVGVRGQFRRYLQGR